MSESGRVAGIEAPLMDSLINLFLAFLNTDFKTLGVTLNRIGLSRLSEDQIIEGIS